jgi:tetratricopeptide (TPR) repeat protein
MICPKCGAAYVVDWGCIRCGVVKTDELEWEGSDDFNVESTSEAMIIGPAVEWSDEPSVTPGALSQPDGSTSALLYYSLGHPSMLLDPDAIPVLRPPPPSHVRSPFEEMISTWIDGTRTVREVASDQVLAPQEIVANLIAMRERGLIEIRPPTLRSEYLLELEEVRDAPAEPLRPPEVAPMAPPQRWPTPPPLAARSSPIPTAAPPLADPAPPAPKGSGARAPSIPARPVREIDRRSVSEEPAAERRGRRVPLPRSDSRNAQARRLYDQALLDRERGQLLSAHTNIKLALAFDPMDSELRTAMRLISDEVASATRGESRSSKAAALFEKASREEAHNVDQAIEDLEEALSLWPDARYYNRLGVILAMRKRDLVRGAQLLEKAVSLSPTTDTYRHNLEKVTLMRSASFEHDRMSKKPEDPGLLGLFGRRR